MITLTREEAQQVLDALYSMSGTEFLCQAAHHPKKDMHKSGEVCPVAARYMEAREALRARLSAPEPSIVEDAIVYGTGITKGGKRIEPDSIYKEPEPPCKTGSQCIGGKCPQCVVSEPEPYGYFKYDLRLDAWVQNRVSNNGVAFYTAPLQREWQGLTDEEKNEITWGKTVYEILDLAEAKLKEKNNDLP
jgi:hypothetical protein